jgi:serine/threonine protein kinase/tetratricopeptide (TPR) repeat protein
MKCPKCKTDNPEDSQFCRKCGTSLTKIPATLTSPPPEKEKKEKDEKSALDFSPGQYFGKRYQIIEEIGRGGMGRVYKALDKELNRTVALKMIKPEISSHPGIVERFKREIKLASQITHENVCRIHDLGEVKGIKYISMEYIKGNNLKEFIQSSKRLSLETALPIAEQICQALTAAHKKGVIHRDLKPQNIMIDKKGNAYVMDFGIARSLEAEEVTKPGAIIGTPAYISPEQAEGKPADTRSDIYSLGCIMYEMLTGAPPFKADTSAALIHKHVTKAPQSPSSINPQISKELDKIILTCLEKKPDSRYSSAEMLWGYLKQLSTPKLMKKKARPPRLVLKWMLLPLGTIIAIIAMLVGLNVGGLREHLFGGVKPGQIQSVAVLPLENLSGDPEQEYFSDGMTDAIITNLARIGALKVISRTSVMQYKGVKKPLREIARELKVDAVIEGTVMRAEGRVRITAQLIEAEADRHLWAESYEREMRNILALQNELAQAIAKKIKVVLSPDEKERLVRSQPVNPEAYEAYLKGRYFLNKLTAEAFQKAYEQFHQAIDKDPSWAQAYAGLSLYYCSLGSFSLRPYEEVFPKAKAAAIKALNMDESLTEAYTALSYINMMYDWDWAAAEKSSLRAIEISPNDAEAHIRYSWYLKNMGRFDEAIFEGQRALELDPLSVAISYRLGRIFYDARQYDRSIEQYHKTIEMDPNFMLSYLWLSYPYTQKGMYEEAIATLQKWTKMSKGWYEPLANLAVVYAYSGKREEAEKILEELPKLKEQRIFSSYFMALIYAALNQKDKAFEWLEKAYEERNLWIVNIKVDPILDSIRSDSRYKELLKKMNLE